MSFGNSETMAKAKEAATVLLACFSKVPASEAQIFAAKLVELLLEYPGSEQWISDRIIRKFKFFPSLAEVREEIQNKRAEDAAEFEQAQRYENWGRKQIEPPKPTEEEKAAVEARRRAFCDGDTKHSGGQYSRKAMIAKLGISEGQWDAIPDQPKRVADLETDPTGQPVRGGFRKIGEAAADYSHVKPIDPPDHHPEQLQAAE